MFNNKNISIIQKYKLYAKMISFVLTLSFLLIGFYEIRDVKSNDNLITNIRIIKHNSDALEAINDYFNHHHNNLIKHAELKKTLEYYYKQTVNEDIKLSEILMPYKKSLDNLVLSNSDEQLKASRQILRELHRQSIKTANNLTQESKSINQAPIIFIGTITFFSILFMNFIVWDYTNKINRSLLNLLKITKEYSKGNLEYSSKNSNLTEIDNLSSELKEMANDLIIHREKLLLEINQNHNLLNLTNLFQKAFTENDIYETLYKYLKNYFPVNHLFFYQLNSHEEKIDLKCYFGEDSKENLIQSFPLSDIPDSIEVFGLRKTKYFYNFESVVMPGLNHNSIVYPLYYESSPYGFIILSYETNKVPSENQKVFLEALIKMTNESVYKAKLYDKAKEAIALRDDFMSIAAHELKTPLTPLKMTLQMMNHKILNSPQLIDTNYLLKICKSSTIQIDKVSQLIDDLMNVSQISSGNLILQKENFLVVPFIEDILKNHSLNYPNSSPIDYKCNIIEKDIKVFWDSNKIEQIILNLLSNATKYAAGSKIYVEVNYSYDDQSISICIRDFGPGIDMKLKETIFKKYERLNKNISIKGLGLGLYISREIAVLHKGKLELKEHDGPGALFCITLPINNN